MGIAGIGYGTGLQYSRVEPQREEKNTMGKEPQLRVEPRSRHRDCGTRTSQASAVWSSALHFKAF